MRLGVLVGFSLAYLGVGGVFVVRDMAARRAANRTPAWNPALFALWPVAFVASGK